MSKRQKIASVIVCIMMLASYTLADLAVNVARFRYDGGKWFSIENIVERRIQFIFPALILFCIPYEKIYASIFKQIQNTMDTDKRVVQLKYILVYIAIVVTGACVYYLLIDMAPLEKTEFWYLVAIYPSTMLVMLIIIELMLIQANIAVIRVGTALVLFYAQLRFVCEGMGISFSVFIAGGLYIAFNMANWLSSNNKNKIINSSLSLLPILFLYATFDRWSSNLDFLREFSSNPSANLSSILEEEWWYFDYPVTLIYMKLGLLPVVVIILFLLFSAITAILVGRVVLSRKRFILLMSCMGYSITTVVYSALMGLGMAPYVSGVYFTSVMLIPGLAILIRLFVRIPVKKGSIDVGGDSKEERFLSMIHYMKLNDEPFECLKSGMKLYELRLYDQRRRKINVNDLIVFYRDANHLDEVSVSVKALHVYPSFQELFEEVPPEKCGFTTIETALEYIYSIYSADSEAQYGVIAIRVKLENPEHVQKIQNQITQDEYNRYFPDGVK